MGPETYTKKCRQLHCNKCMQLYLKQVYFFDVGKRWNLFLIQTDRVYIIGLRELMLRVINEKYRSVFVILLPYTFSPFLMNDYTVIYHFSSLQYIPYLQTAVFLL